MSKIMYIQASPREELSESRAVADAFVASYRKDHPEDEVAILDLFKAELPALDDTVLKAKYTILHGQQHSAEEAAAWKSVERVIEEFKSADKYVVAVPMWNFGIPYRLKQYLDILIQPGYTFSASEEGYEGLAGGKPVLVVYARGGEYPEGSDMESYDMQKKYFELALGFMGLADVRSIIVEPTLMGGPETAAEKREAAIAEAMTMLPGF